MSQRKKTSPIKGLIVTLFFGLLLVGASILSEKAPDKVNNFIEENLNISATDNSNLITVNTVGVLEVPENSKLNIYYLDVVMNGWKRYVLIY